MVQGVKREAWTRGPSWDGWMRAAWGVAREARGWGRDPEAIPPRLTPHAFLLPAEFLQGSFRLPEIQEGRQLASLQAGKTHGQASGLERDIGGNAVGGTGGVVAAAEE